MRKKKIQAILIRIIQYILIAGLVSLSGGISQAEPKRILVDASRDGGAWWFPQGDDFSPDLPHQGKALADYLESLGYQVTELRRPTTITGDLLAAGDIVIRANEYGEYTSSEIDAYHYYVETGGRVLLLSDFKSPAVDRDSLAFSFGILLQGTCSGVVDRFEVHPITADVSSLPYIAGSGITDLPETANILGYVSQAYLDLNNNGRQDPGEPSSPPVLGEMTFGQGKIVFCGDTNMWETVPQPLVDNTINWLIPEPCVAAFSASPTAGSAPLTVQFADGSTGRPITWTWDFGDQGTSSQQNPSHAYSSAGTYTVTLTVRNQNGSDTETKSDYIHVKLPVLNPAEISITPSCASVGTPATISVNTTKSGIYFRYWVNDTSYCDTGGSASWSLLKDWTTDTTAAWTPTTNGRKTVVVWVTDDTSNSCVRMIGASYEVGSSNCTDAKGVRLSSATGSVNEAVTMTATGSERGLLYRFYVNNNSCCTLPGNPDWELLQDWSAENNCTWTPRSDGLYTLIVWTTDDTRNACIGMGGMTYQVGKSVGPTFVPDTGQTQSYTDTFGEDSDYTINPPSYTKLDSHGSALPDSATSWSMVKDNVTGLIWEAKSDDGSIHDKDKTYTWYDSDPATNGGKAGTPGDGTDTEDFINALNSTHFGGYSDWRLPTIKELSLIVKSGTYGPAIDMEYFPNTAGTRYWASTTLTSGPNSAWGVDFGEGTVSYFTKSESSNVRAVRGPEACSSGPFVDNGDGTVTDTSTGLIWQKGSAEEMIWEEALTYCEGLSLGGYSDWRLPSRNELQSIVDYGSFHPTIDTDYFPGTVSDSCWSSTTSAYTYGSSESWRVDFFFGQFSPDDKTIRHHVRAVRGGQ